MKHILRLAIVALSLSAEQAQAEISYGDILADPDNPVLNQGPPTFGRWRCQSRFGGGRACLGGRADQFGGAAVSR